METLAVHNDTIPVIYPDLRSSLRERFHAHDVHLTGRGASAIYAACRVIGHPGAWIGVPSHVCASVPLAVIRAGKRPWFVDIDTDDFNIDPDKLKNLPKDTSALIAPHMYGHPLKVDQIKDFCQSRNILFIEDIAQAVGSRIDGREVGTFGDFAIMSFHPSKLIPGKGGGALILNKSMNRFSERITREINSLPIAPSDSSVRSNELTSDVNRLLNLTRDGETHERDIARLYLQNLDLIIQRNNENFETANLSAMSGLDKGIRERQERARLYSRLIKSDRIRHPVLKSGSPLFRYSILVDSENGSGLRRIITDRLRSFGIHASNLYYPSHLIFSEQPDQILPGSEYVAERVINLWLDDTATEQYIFKTAEIIEDSI